MKPLAMIIAAGFLLGSCAKEEKNPANPSNNNTSTVDTSRVKTTSGGQYRVSLSAPDTIPAGDITLSFPLTVKLAADTSQAVTGLTLGVSFIHAVMMHGGSEIPYAVENGNGLYTLHDVDATMAAPWELTVTLGSPPTDTVRFRVEAK